MNEIERRTFIRRAVEGATIGALAFTVGGVEVMLTPEEAHAQGVPLDVVTEMRRPREAADQMKSGATTTLSTTAAPPSLARLDSHQTAPLRTDQ